MDKKDFVASREPITDEYIDDLYRMRNELRTEWDTTKAMALVNAMPGLIREIRAGRAICSALGEMIHSLRTELTKAPAEETPLGRVKRLHAEMTEAVEELEGEMWANVQD